MKQFEAIVVVPRMYPFKTKLKPNYKIDWGYQEITSEIPTRNIVAISKCSATRSTAYIKNRITITSSKFFLP